MALLIAAVALIGSTTSCSSTSSTTSSSAAGVPALGARLSAADFAAAAAQPGVTIVDVRTPAEFASGHIDGAVNIDIEGADFASQISALPKDGAYAVYCRSGNR